MSVTIDQGFDWLDFFCGAGGSTTGLIAAGATVRLAANHWPLAISSHSANHPGVDHSIADLCLVDFHAYPSTFALWGSPECFPAGTLILTRRGLVPIEDVQVGDHVLTHRRRWRRVTGTTRRRSDTVIVRGAGHHGGLETTPEHPFYARTARQVWNNDLRQYRRHLGEPAWTVAKNLTGSFWSSPAHFRDRLPIPEVGGGRGIEFTGDLWWLVGRWLGDGCLRLRYYTPEPLPPIPRRRSQPAGAACIVCGAPARPDRRSANGRVSPYCGADCKRVNKRPHKRTSRGEVQITCGAYEAEEVAKRLAAVDGLRWHRRDQRTAVVFTAAHIRFAQWLREHFGEYAHGKRVPAWALTMPEAWRAALLDGYLSADGATQKLMTSASTVSKQLALGVRLLALSLGYNAYLAGPRAQHNTIIEGRRVTTRPVWSVAWTAEPHPKHVQSVIDAELLWSRVRSVAPGRRNVEVFNLSVEQDESYVADGIVVHNCTWASRARGEAFEIQQMSLLEKARHNEKARSRATMYDIWRYAEIHQPEVVVVENVKEVYTRFPEHWRQWWHDGEKLGYRLKVLSLNSMIFGAPQSRNRIYVIAVRAGRPWPDLEFRPSCWCPTCERTVEGVQSWRNTRKIQIGCYGEQYDYRCPTCAKLCWPWVRPAASVIDWSLEGVRIGDRPSLGMKPLADGTIERISKGLVKFGLRQAVVPTDRNSIPDSKLVRPVGLPLPTQTARATMGLYSVPFLTQGAGNTFERPGSTCRSRGVDEPMRTQTGTVSDALIEFPVGRRLAEVGEPWVLKYYGTSTGSRVDEPLGAVTSGGNHHAMVVPPGVDPRHVYVVAHYSPGWTRRATDEPLGTITSHLDHHSIVGVRPAMLVPSGGTWRRDPAPTMAPFPTRTTSETDGLVTVPLLVPYYGNGRARRVDQPMNTIRSVDTNALVEAGVNVNVEDCTFRMLEWYESMHAMAFPRDYTLHGNKREKTKQAGNAVTPPVATALAERIHEAFAA